MIPRKPRARREKPIMTPEQKKVIIELLVKIVGDTIKGKLGRIAAAGAIAAAATYMDVPVPPTPQPAAPIPSAPVIAPPKSEVTP